MNWNNSPFTLPVLMNLMIPWRGSGTSYGGGDKIVWTSLFKHYIYCLNQTLMSIRVLGNNQVLEAEHIPVMASWNKPPTRQMGELFRTVWNGVYDELKLSLLVENLEKYQRKVRFGELQHYLYLGHFPMIAKIQDAHIDYGLATEEERLQPLHNPLETLLRNNTYFELLQQLELEHEKFSEKWFLRMQQVTEDQRLRQKYNFRKANTGSDTFERNKQFLLFDFTKNYIEQLSRLLWPNWYAACFTKDYSDSSLWAHYTDGHKGVCLIFKTNESPDGIHLELKPLASELSDSSRYTEENWRYSPMSFHDIEYKDKFVSIDFFRRLGRLPVPELLDSWYINEEGIISESASHISSHTTMTAWIKEYWDDFEKDICVKSTAWKYERECRLISHGLLQEDLTENCRTWTYDFESLKGIIFGIRSSDDDKMKVIETVQKKCQEHNRTDFPIFQAYYDPQDGRIHKSP